MAADLQREDQLGAGFASFLATLLLAALLYAIMLGLLTVTVQRSHTHDLLQAAPPVVSPLADFDGVAEAASGTSPRRLDGLHGVHAPHSTGEQVAHAVRNNEEIVIRNDDDARDVRYKRRKREGLPDDFFLTTGYSYDWIFVFQVRNEWDELSDFQKEFSMKRVINSLTMAGAAHQPWPTALKILVV